MPPIGPICVPDIGALAPLVSTHPTIASVAIGSVATATCSATLALLYPGMIIASKFRAAIAIAFPLTLDIYSGFLAIPPERGDSDESDEEDYLPIP